jgi:hypothetical protein
MVSSNLKFSLLCAGELVIVLAGMVSIPAAVALQILIPLIIFHDLFLSTAAYQPLPFAAAFAFGTLAFAILLVSFRHTLLPLVLLAIVTVLAFFSLTMAEARMQRRYGGVS